MNELAPSSIVDLQRRCLYGLVRRDPAEHNHIEKEYSATGWPIGPWNNHQGEMNQCHGPGDYGHDLAVWMVVCWKMEVAPFGIWYVFFCEKHLEEGIQALLEWHIDVPTATE